MVLNAVVDRIEATDLTVHQSGACWLRIYREAVTGPARAKTWQDEGLAEPGFGRREAQRRTIAWAARPREDAPRGPALKARMIGEPSNSEMKRVKKSAPSGRHRSDV